MFLNHRRFGNFFCLFVLFLAFGFWLSWVEFKATAWDFKTKQFRGFMWKQTFTCQIFKQNHTRFYVFNLLKNLYETAVGFILFWNAFVIAVHKKHNFCWRCFWDSDRFGFWIQAKGFIVLPGSSSSSSSSSSRVLDCKSVIFSAVQHKFIQI